MEKKLKDILSKYTKDAPPTEPLLTERQFLDIFTPHVRRLMTFTNSLSIGASLLIGASIYALWPGYLVLLIAIVPIIVGLTVYFTAP